MHFPQRSVVLKDENISLDGDEENEGLRVASNGWKILLNEYVNAYGVALKHGISTKPKAMQWRRAGLQTRAT